MPYEITTNKDALDINLIHAHLSETYWGRGRSLEIVRRSFENSLPFVIVQNGETCGFARVVTDYATFAWICDVYILPSFRGVGLSKLLMQTIIEHPDLQGLRRILLATRDAHGLYAQFDFTELKIKSLWMERTAPNAYADFNI